MKRLSSVALRQLWLDFFTQHHHLALSPQSLIPKDESLLFVNSGVATLKPFFEGTVRPPASRLVNSQRAIRTNDIENIGKTSRHHTFFEMLGNFSIGDYFKEVAIQLAHQFLTQTLEVDDSKLYFTVYEQDDVAYEQWLRLGIAPNHILKTSHRRNFWDLGQGPCGPCSEIFYDRGPTFDPLNQGERLFVEDLENDRYIEIWNIVFSEFNNDGHGNYQPLAQKNIDTGMGLERLVCISQAVPTNFDSDLFLPMINYLVSQSPFNYDMMAYFHPDNQVQQRFNTAFKVVVDHFKAVSFSLCDGAFIGPKKQGYVLRKLFRRMLTYARILALQPGYLAGLYDVLVSTMGPYYAWISAYKTHVLSLMEQEQALFEKSLNRGLKFIAHAKRQATPVIAAFEVFQLISTYGFNRELFDELVTLEGLSYDQVAVNQLFAHHQQLSSHNQKFDHKMLQQTPALVNLRLPSKFIYQQLTHQSQIIQLFNHNFEVVDQLVNQPGYVVLAETVFYPVSGGQMHDCGWILNSQQEVVATVEYVFKGLHQQCIHQVTALNLQSQQTYQLKVDAPRRLQLSRQHLAEHLLHACVKRFIDSTAKQEGAFKGVDKITLDFKTTHYPTAASLQAIEDYINSFAQAGVRVDTIITDLATAKQLGACAYFEHVYEQQQNLRLVRIRSLEDPATFFSLELCGGTHGTSTAEIEQFMILDLVRVGQHLYRIEALSGQQAIHDYLENHQATMQVALTQLESQLRTYQVWDNAEVQTLIQQFDFQPRLTSFRHNQTLLQALKTQAADHKVRFMKRQTTTARQQLKQQIISQISSQQIVHLVVVVDQAAKIIIGLINELKNEYPHHLFGIFNQLATKIQLYLFAHNTCLLANKLDLLHLATTLKTRFNLAIGGQTNFVQGGFKEAHILVPLQQFLTTYIPSKPY